MRRRSAGRCHGVLCTALVVVMVCFGCATDDGTDSMEVSCSERAERLSKAVRNLEHPLEALHAAPTDEALIRETMATWSNVAAALAGFEGCDGFGDARKASVEVHDRLNMIWSACQTAHGEDWFDAWVSGYGAAECGPHPSWPIGV